MKKTLLAVAVATAAGTASAGVVNLGEAAFTFQDPTGQREMSYTAPANPGGMGQLTYNASIPFDFKVDTTDAGGGEVTYGNTNLTMNASVGAISNPFGNVFVASLNGSFEFEFDGDAILSGTFTDGALLINLDVGSVVASAASSNLTMLAGGALLADFVALDPFFLQLDAIDVAWTLTDVTPVIEQDRWRGTISLESFTANSAFSGTGMVVLIPTPGATALATIALGMVAVRRKRA